jgi:hypothetical protein
MSTACTAASLGSLASLSLNLDLAVASSSGLQSQTFQVVVERSPIHHSPSLVTHVVKVGSKTLPLQRHNSFDRERWKYWQASTRTERSRARITYYPESANDNPLFMECTVAYLRDGHFDQYLKSLHFPCGALLPASRREPFLRQVGTHLGPGATESWLQLERLASFLNSLFEPVGACKVQWIHRCTVAANYQQVSFDVQTKLIKFMTALQTSGVAATVQSTNFWRSYSRVVVQLPPRPYRNSSEQQDPGTV